jgi:hypothetical protein
MLFFRRSGLRTFHPKNLSELLREPIPLIRIEAVEKRNVFKAIEEHFHCSYNNIRIGFDSTRTCKKDMAKCFFLRILHRFTAHSKCTPSSVFELWNIGILNIVSSQCPTLTEDIV